MYLLLWVLLDQSFDIYNAPFIYIFAVALILTGKADSSA